MIGNVSRALGFASLAALLAGCASTSIQPTSSASWDDRPAFAETLYQKRLAQLMAARGRIDYDIIGPVAGAAAPVALPRSSTTRISGSSLSQAREYAARMNSSSLIVWDNDAIVAEHYFGEASAEKLLPSKSLSKPMASIAIGRAIKLGHIKGLDQSVADFITEWQGTDKQAMTIRDVLLMQTGLLEQSFDMDPNGPLMRAYIDPYHEQFIVEKYPLTEKPGTRYSYSNATGDLIAIVIERAAGKPYDRFIGEDVLAPIGAAGGEAWLNRPDGKTHSGCCMFFTAETYLKLGKLLLEKGVVGGTQFLPAGYVDEMRKPSRFNPHYGLGVWIGSPYKERRGFLGADNPAPKIFHSAPYLAKDVYLFDGSGSQVVYIVPSRGVIVLRTGNNPTIDEEWDNAFLINTILGGMQ